MSDKLITADRFVMESATDAEVEAWWVKIGEWEAILRAFKAAHGDESWYAVARYTLEKPWKWKREAYAQYVAERSDEGATDTGRDCGDGGGQ